MCIRAERFSASPNVAGNFASYSRDRYRRITLAIRNLHAIQSLSLSLSLSVCLCLFVVRLVKQARHGKNSWIKGSRVAGGRERVNPLAPRWNTAFTLELWTYAAAATLGYPFCLPCRVLVPRKGRAGGEPAGSPRILRAKVFAYSSAYRDARN